MAIQWPWRKSAIVSSYGAGSACNADPVDGGQVLKWGGRIILVLVGIVLARVVLLLVDPRVYSGVYGSLPNSPWAVLGQSPWSWLLDAVYLISNVLVAPAAWLVAQWSALTGRSAMGSVNHAGAAFLQPYLYPESTLTPEQAQHLVELAPGVLDGAALATVMVMLLVGVALPLMLRSLQRVYWQWWTEWRYRQEQDQALKVQLLAQKQAMAGMNKNLSALQETASLLYRQNVMDPLTQLYNKRFFTEKLEDVFNGNLKRGQSFALMMMDIDHFKRLNDTYGHPMGDKVLQAVAQVLIEQTPKSCFACRYGGEEFGIIFSQQSMAIMVQVGDRIRAGVAGLHFEEHPELQVTISQGLAAVFPASGATVEIATPQALLTCSDKALYASKEGGRNRLTQQVFGESRLSV